MRTELRSRNCNVPPRWHARNAAFTKSDEGSQRAKVKAAFPLTERSTEPLKPQHRNKDNAKCGHPCRSERWSQGLTHPDRHNTFGKQHRITPPPSGQDILSTKLWESAARMSKENLTPHAARMHDRSLIFPPCLMAGAGALRCCCVCLPSARLLRGR